MALENKWVGYLDRSYLNIKNSILKRLGESVPEVTDHSESNILVVIISMFAGVAEMLNYYIDNMARESFITTARRYSSVVKLTRLIDYRIKAMIPASTNLTLSFLDSVELPKQSATDLNIPQGLIFTTNNGMSFISIQDVNIPAGSYGGNIPVQQKTLLGPINLGTTTAVPDQVYEIGNAYVHNSITLYLSGEPWLEVDSLGRSGAEDKHFVIEITVDRKAIIKFGDGYNGKIPDAGKDIIATYYTSQGVLGNVEPGTITQTQTSWNLQLLGVSETRITNANKAVAGTDYESIERIKRSAPLHIRTLERAVTKQDYEDLTLLAPGVDKSRVHFDCGKTVDIYIAPNEGGIASGPLLQSTLEYMETKKMITTFLSVKPAGEGEIIIDVDVWAKFRRDPIQTRADVREALNLQYNYKASSINRKIRLSDIIALIDNLDKVDYLKIKSIYLKPYFRALVDGTNELLHTLTVTNKSVEKVIWRLQYDGTYMRLLKNNNHVGNITIGQTFTDPEGIINLNIQHNGYQVGNEWQFITYKFNDDIDVDDFTVPVINLNNSTITVFKQVL